MPTAAVTEMISTANGMLIGIEPEIRASLMEKSVVFGIRHSSHCTYDNQDEDVETLAIRMMLMVDASVDEEVVYNLINKIWKTWD